MKAPDKICIRKDDTAPLGFTPHWIYTTKVQEYDIEYIRKDALVEWLLKGVEFSEICHSEYGDACAQAYQAVIDKLNKM